MNSMQQRGQAQSRQHLFTASEVAQFEYCPLVWWHEQFEPLAQASDEELFARMVELEYDHGAQATTLPEYQTIEQLLLRGALLKKDVNNISIMPVKWKRYRRRFIEESQLAAHAYPGCTGDRIALSGHDYGYSRHFLTLNLTHTLFLIAAS